MNEQREIRFRAWDKESKKLSKPFGLAEIHCPHGETIFAGQLHFSRENDFVPMQFTGLFDKQGKEIYEGDIVTMTVRENIGTFNVPDDIVANGGYTGRDDIYEGEVVFKDFGFCVNDIKEGEFYLQPMEDTFFEVIGNIYENKELLK